MEFLVELYLERGDPDAIEGLRAQAAAASGNTRDGVRLLRSIVVPDDESCFLVYEASSAARVEAALEQAGLRYERVSRSLSDPPQRGAP